jgi:hypothetical protein
VFHLLKSGQIYITQESGAIMTSTNKASLSGDEVQKTLDETLSDSENSSFYSDDYSNVTEDVPTRETAATVENGDEGSDTEQD